LTNFFKQKKQKYLETVTINNVLLLKVSADVMLLPSWNLLGASNLSCRQTQYHFI